MYSKTEKLVRYVLHQRKMAFSASGFYYLSESRQEAAAAGSSLLTVCYPTAKVLLLPRESALLPELG